MTNSCDLTELPDGGIIGRVDAVRFIRIPTTRDRREIDGRKAEIIAEATAGKLKPRRRKRIIWN